MFAEMRSVEGLAYDNDHLYFTYQSTSEDSQPAIKYVNVAIKPYKLQVLLSLGPSDAPRAIAIHSCSGWGT